MWHIFKRLVSRDWAAKTALLIFLALFAWWFLLQVLYQGQDAEKNLIWAATYQLVALLGAIWGLFVSRSWGGTKSVFGRAIGAFALGLLFQTIGQSVFSFYNLILKVEIPYPSLADVGFFGSIPLYVYGVILLGRASGAVVSLRRFRNQLSAFLLPAAALLISYLFFLRGYEFDWSSPLRVFLDFAYPLGQATYVSFALLVFIITKKILGGIMRPRVLFILIALAVQYLADYNFLFQVSRLTWVNGGYGDLIYLAAYLFMSLALLQIKSRYIQEAD